MPGDLKFEDWNNDGIIDGKDDQLSDSAIHLVCIMA